MTMPPPPTRPTTSAVLAAMETVPPYQSARRYWSLAASWMAAC